MSIRRSGRPEEGISAVTVPLRDNNGARVDFVTMGLGWDPARPGRWFTAKRADIDLNAAALLFVGEQLTDVVYHEKLTSDDGAIRHQGDSITGEGDGDDEVIAVDLTRVDPRITAIMFLVTCYTGQTFAEIDNAFCRLVDGGSGAELARYDLPADHHTGLIMGVVARTEHGWEFRGVDEGIEARHPVDAVPLVGQFLR
ncbi:TerD family protein [Nocardia arthritidis]|uniref:TerD family protein n=1 Tax=Nocardia arthritidis TaxID=228602 RepID=A0A6G9YGB2_9NOCA|nr:TerD family protein [Nocardia arthritidis]QIS12107.1 TerD family protein [Nocardia arthritidis]